MKTRKTNGRNSRHDEWEFEKYSDRELVEAIRRIEKYRREANSYRRKYNESERRANWTYTAEQFGEIARM